MNGESNGAGNPKLWFVLHVKSRQEKALAKDLGAMRLSYYLPLREEIRLHGGRKASIEEPLFPGYVFLMGTADDVYRADRTKRVANIIRVADQQKLNWELNNIRLALEREATLDPYPHLVTGRRVEVRLGPLRGIQGVVEGRGRVERLILQVDVLGRAVSLEIDGNLLEPVAP